MDSTPMVEMQTSRLASLSPLAVNAASTIIGFISLCILYKALVAQKLVSHLLIRLVQSTLKTSAAHKDEGRHPSNILAWSNGC